MNTHYVVAGIVAVVVFFLLLWLSAVKAKGANYAAGTFGGWTVLWSIFLVIVTLIVDQTPIVHNTVRDLLDVIGRAGRGASEGVTAPIDPQTTSPAELVEWADAAHAKIKMKAGKTLPDGWRVSVVLPPPAPPTVIVGEVIVPGAGPAKVYWDPDRTKLPGKNATVPVDFPR